jgi:hypothetical protein
VERGQRDREGDPHSTWIRNRDEFLTKQNFCHNPHAITNRRGKNCRILGYGPKVTNSKITMYDTFESIWKEAYFKAQYNHLQETEKNNERNAIKIANVGLKF